MQSLRSTSRVRRGVGRSTAFVTQLPPKDGKATFFAAKKKKNPQF